MGRLQEMLDIQKEFDDVVIKRSWKERGKGVSDQELILAVRKELNELEDEYNWKWWKKLFKEVLSRKKIELIDIFCFLFGLCNRYGLTEEKLYEVYCFKMKKNHKRQDKGY